MKKTGAGAKAWVILNQSINQSINQHFIDITLRIRYSHLQLKTKLQTNNRVINALLGYTQTGGRLFESLQFYDRLHRLRVNERENVQIYIVQIKRIRVTGALEQRWKIKVSLKHEVWFNCKHALDVTNNS